jgi:hypothetical protein
LATKFGAENVLVVSGDVQDPASATDLVGQAVEHFGSRCCVRDTTYSRAVHEQKRGGDTHRDNSVA